jgi:hypothetical protein
VDEDIVKINNDYFVGLFFVIVGDYQLFSSLFTVPSLGA